MWPQPFLCLSRLDKEGISLPEQHPYRSVVGGMTSLTYKDAVEAIIRSLYMVMTWQLPADVVVPLLERVQVYAFNRQFTRLHAEESWREFVRLMSSTGGTSSYMSFLRWSRHPFEWFQLLVGFAAFLVVMDVRSHIMRIYRHGLSSTCNLMRLVDEDVARAVASPADASFLMGMYRHMAQTEGVYKRYDLNDIDRMKKSLFTSKATYASGTSIGAPVRNLSYDGSRFHVVYEYIPGRGCTPDHAWIQSQYGLVLGDTHGGNNAALTAGGECVQYDADLNDWTPWTHLWLDVFQEEKGGSGQTYVSRVTILENP